MGYYTPVFHLAPPSRRHLAESHDLEHGLHAVVEHCVFNAAWHRRNLHHCDASFDLLCELATSPSRAVAAALALYAYDRCRGNERLLDHHGELAHVNGWAHRIPDLRVRCVAAHDDWTCLVEVDGRLQALVRGRGATELFYFGPLAEDTCRAILRDCLTACYDGYEAEVGLPAILRAVADDPWRPVHECWFHDYEARQAPAVDDPLLRRLACAYADDWPAAPSVRALADRAACIYDGGDEPAELHMAYINALIERAAAAGLLPAE